MQRLFDKHIQMIRTTPNGFSRQYVNTIHWDLQLLAIRGPKGVGKSTIMKQYIQQHYDLYDKSVLYCSCDGVYFSSHSLLELADDFYKHGGKHLFLILNLLYSDLQTVKKLQKPDKIYLENSNLQYALASTPVQLGTVREVFAVNQLSHLHKVEYSKQKGDFRIDSKYTIEVGGAGNTFKQIADVPMSYIFADDIENPDGNKMPLWLLGFLY